MPGVHGRCSIPSPLLPEAIGLCRVAPARRRAAAVLSMMVLVGWLLLYLLGPLWASLVVVDVGFGGLPLAWSFGIWVAWLHTVNTPPLKRRAAACGAVGGARDGRAASLRCGGALHASRHRLQCMWGQRTALTPPARVERPGLLPEKAVGGPAFRVYMGLPLARVLQRKGCVGKR